MLAIISAAVVILIGWLLVFCGRCNVFYLKQNTKRPHGDHIYTYDEARVRQIGAPLLVLANFLWNSVYPNSMFGVYERYDQRQRKEVGELDSY